MHERMRRLLIRFGLAPRERPLPGEAPTFDDTTIEFRPLNPARDFGAKSESSIVCPVTRRALKSGDRIYVCSSCSTSYSEAGWRFLVQVDRGRCCQCRRAGCVIDQRESKLQ